MSSIALHGMVTSRNFGDILMLDIVARHLIASGHDVTVPMASAGVARDAGTSGNIGRRGFRHSDTLVYPGGGYFSPEKPPALRKMAAIAGKFAGPSYLLRKGAPHHVLGVGVGPLAGHGLFSAFMRRFFEHAAVLTVRDEESLDELKRLGVRRKDVDVVADIALNLTPDLIPAAAIREAEETLRPLRQRYERIIGIHLSSMPVSQPYREVWQAVVAFAADCPDAGFLLIEDHPADEGAPSDQLRAARDLHTTLGERAIVAPYSHHYTLAALLSQLDGVFTNKLHVAIVASSLDRLAVAVAKHPKNHRFFRQINASRRCIGLGAEARDIARIMRDGFSEPRSGPVVDASLRALAAASLKKLDLALQR